jgi:hypothetical protein
VVTKREAEAFRVRAGMIAVLQSCLCTYPVENHDTETGHAFECPGHHHEMKYRELEAMAAASAEPPPTKGKRK